jgi:hypothetical protein
MIPAPLDKLIINICCAPGFATLLQRHPHVLPVSVEKADPLSARILQLKADG